MGTYQKSEMATLNSRYLGNIRESVSIGYGREKAYDLSSEFDGRRLCSRSHWFLRNEAVMYCEGVAVGADACGKRNVVSGQRLQC